MLFYWFSRSSVNLNARDSETFLRNVWDSHGRRYQQHLSTGVGRMCMVNIWHLRKVAEASARPCDICYKLTSAVLITPNNQVIYDSIPSYVWLTDRQDHFYVCQSHVKDHGFCSPIVDEAEVTARKKKEEMDHEIEIIKKEYEEKMKKIKGKDNSKKDDKDKDKAMDKRKEDGEKDAEDDNAEKEEQEKVSWFDQRLTIRRKSAESLPQDQSCYWKHICTKHRIHASNLRTSKVSSSVPFELFSASKLTVGRVFYQKRLDRKRTAEIAKRRQERFNALKNPSLFPSVPKDNLGWLVQGLRPRNYIHATLRLDVDRSHIF